jgi:hypothetical protein
VRVHMLHAVANMACNMFMSVYQDFESKYIYSDTYIHIYIFSIIYSLD